MAQVQQWCLEVGTRPAATARAFLPAVPEHVGLQFPSRIPMNLSPAWSRALFWLGAGAFVLGALDPLEGAGVILAGSLLVRVSAGLPGAPLRCPRRWTLVTALIAAGVAAMFGLSAGGGIGGDTGRSWAWGLLLLPYPVGWLLGVGTLIIHARTRRRSPT